MTHRGRTVLAMGCALAGAEQQPGRPLNEIVRHHMNHHGESEERPDTLTREDLRILHQALNEILHGPEAIEEWEFHTRVGATRDEATSLMKRLGDLLVRGNVTERRDV